MESKFTAAEISKSLDVAKRTVNRWAKDEQWDYTQELENGVVVKKFVLSLMPENRQLALITASAATQALTATKKLTKISDLKNWQRDIMDARVALFREYQRMERKYGTNEAIKEFCLQAKTGTLPDQLQSLVEIANARGGGNGRTISKSTLYRWKAMNKRGVAAFAPQTIEKKDIPPWATCFIGCYGTPDKPSIPQAMERMAKVLPNDIAMPSYGQVYRFHTKRSRLEREKGRRTGSELKALKGYRKRDTSDLLPMEIGTCDGHSFKSRVAHPVHGAPFKPEICSVVDVATRVLVGWSVGLAESSVTVGSAVRHAATVNEQKPCGGVFSILYTDGGSGNKAKVLTHKLTGVFARIGTRWEKGIPGNAQGRGLIERLNSSLWIPAAKELPTFVGKEMDSLTERNLRLLVNREIKKDGRSVHLPTWPQFIEHCQQSVDVYNRRPHSGLPKINDPKTGRRRHMAPLEMWSWHVQQGWNQKECQLTEEEIEMIFLPRQECMVRRACVQLFTNTYYNRNLEHYDGERVQVGYDIHNADMVQIWDKDGRMICYAHFDKNKSSYFPRPVIDQANEQRAKRRRQIKLDQIAEIDAEECGLIEIKPAKQAIESDAATLKLQADKKELQEKIAAKACEVTIPLDDKGKYLLWNRLDATLNNSGIISEKEMKFYEAYRKSTSYRAFRSVAETLGQQQEQAM